MKQNNPSLFDIKSIDYSKYCGIDEAGRGPIAGPLVVAGVKLFKNIDGLKDSKKLTAKKREELYKIIKESSKYYIYEISAQKIDEIGLSKAIKEALKAIKEHFKGSKFIFDGNSSFGVDNIETLIKADSKVESVKAASILAKVYRDKLMIKFAKVYPNYNFDKHKGYCTKAHLEAIAKYGYCEIHRKSFKINLPSTSHSLI